VGGGPHVLLVVGDAGVGKTTLLRRALDEHPGAVVWGSGDPLEVELDHSLLDQLARAAPLSAEDRAALGRDLAGGPATAGPALVALLDHLPLDPDRPPVVVVDDAQWGDTASLSALAFAARRLQRDPVLLCIVARTTDVDALPLSLRRVVRDQGERVSIGPLDERAVQQLVEQQLGTRISERAAQRLHAHTDGNPLHLVALLDELPLDELTAPGELPAPRSYTAIVVRRLQDLPAETVALVEAVAVLGDGVALATAASVAGIGEVAAAVGPALAQGMLSADDPIQPGLRAVRIPHSLLRAAVLADLGPGRRAGLHRRAGEVVSGTPGLRHRLLGAIAPDAELWSVAVAVASREAEAGAHGTAAALLRSAIDVAPDAEARARCLLDAADQLLLAGRIDAAVALRPDVVRLPPTPHRRYVQARFAYIAGPRRLAVGHLDAAWDDLVGLPPEAVEASAIPAAQRGLAGRIATSRATGLVDRAEGAAALPWCRAGRALAPEQAAEGSASHMLAAAWALTGRFEEGLAELQTLCAALPADAGTPECADLYSARGLLRLWTHDLAGAGQDLTESLAIATARGSFVARETARGYLSEVRYRQGSWDEAIALAELSSSLVDDAEQTWMAVLPHITAARPLAARGLPADEHLRQAHQAAARVRGATSALLLVAELEVAACQRDPDRALEAGEALAALPRAIDERIGAWRATWVELLVDVGRVEEAAQVVRALRGVFEPTFLIRADTARAEAALGAALGDVDLLEAATTAAEALDPAGVGFYPMARVHLVAGRAWRRRGERRRAAALLRAAVRRFQLLDAHPWTLQAERELDACGLRPVRDDNTSQRLTPQEAAVAQLAASGRTNREVAATLVLSVKTVEHHLSRVYAKLGVRSRTELVHTLPDRGDAPGP
jgi:DNA-binding CsgD family transcriptional regulator